MINQTTKLSQNEEKGKFDEENFFKGGKGETVIYKEDKNRSKLAHLIDDNPRNYNPKNETYSRTAQSDISTLPKKCNLRISKSHSLCPAHP